MISTQMRHVNNGISGAGPALWFGLRAPDGDSTEFLQAPPGSVYVYQNPAGSGAIYQKRASLGDDADWFPLSVVASDPTSGVYNVLDYGAVGNGTTDDAVAIQTAATVASSVASSTRPQTLYFPPGCRFACGTGITVGRYVSVVMDSQLYFTGSGVALTIGEATGAVVSARYKLWVVGDGITDWSDETQVGVRTYNLKRCNIEIVSIRNFTIGFEAISGNGGGWVYNNILVGWLYDNKVGADLYCLDSVGWVNENTWIGGTFGISSGGPNGGGGGNASQDAAGIRIGKDGLYPNNRNLFIHPSFELNYVGMSVSGSVVAANVMAGADNRFLDVRVEDNNAPDDRVVFAIASGTGNTRNDFSYGYGLANLQMTDSSGTALNTISRVQPATLVNPIVFDAGPISRRAGLYNGSTQVHVPGMIGLTSAAATTYPYVTGAIDSSGQFVSLSAATQALGVIVDTSACKHFLLVTGCVTNMGTGVVVCFDAEGAVLSGTNPWYIDQVSRASVASWGGAYEIGTAGNVKVIHFHDDVQYAIIAIKGAVNLQTFQIYNMNRYGGASTGAGTNPAAYVDYEEILPGANIGTTYPTAGTWAVGRRIYNAAPSAGGAEGWVCVEAGTPGTWKEFGAVAA